MRLQHALLGPWLAAAAPAPTTPSAVPALAGCSCDGFCRSECSWPSTQGNTLRPQNLTLYRFSPPGNSDPTSLADRNTGDAAGDLAFLLDRRALSARCALEPTNERCFLAPWSGIPFGRWEVEINAQYGPYKSCIPRYTNAHFSAWNVSDFACTQDCDSPTMPGVNNQSNGRCTLKHKNSTRSASDGQSTCFCPRADRTAGALGRSTWSSQPTTTPRWCDYAGLSLVTDQKCIKGTQLYPSNGSFAPSQLPIDADPLGACCAACSADTRCDGYNLVNSSSSAATGHECHLFSNGSLVKDCSQDVWRSSLMPPTSRLVGGSWFWKVSLDPPGSWYSTPKLGRCTEGEAIGTDGCSWRTLAPSVQVHSICVIQRVDDVLSKAKPMQRCLAAFGCGAAPDHEAECWLRCSWAVVGGGNRAPLVESSALLEAFEGAFEPVASGGCPRLGVPMQAA